jgi:Rha family phage regulatory protein
MNDIATLPTPAVTLHGRSATCLSTAVALHFGKRHDNVLRAIATISAALDGVTEKQRDLNFEVTSLFRDEWQPVPGPKGSERMDRVVRMNRDGFALLAMGFTGPEALRWKVAYIRAFNQLEAAVLAELDQKNDALQLATGHLAPVNGELRGRLKVRDIETLHKQGRKLMRDLLAAPQGPERHNIHCYLRGVNDVLGVPTRSLEEIEAEVAQTQRELKNELTSPGDDIGAVLRR